MRSIIETIEYKKQSYGKKFSDKSLNKEFIPYFENGARVEVSFRNQAGKEYEVRRGTIGITTGWIPCFLLMLKINSHGSSYTIGKNDKVLRVIKAGGR
jgi:hypothetical protein